MMPDWDCHCADFVNGKAHLEIETRIGPLPRSWRERAEMYRRLGVRSLAELVGTLFEEVPPLRAMRGDLVMVDGALGVCRGEWAEFMDRMQPMKRATRAWRARRG